MRTSIEPSSAIKFGFHRFLARHHKIELNNLKALSLGCVHTINLLKCYQKNVSQILIFVDCVYEEKKGREWMLSVYGCCFNFISTISLLIPQLLNSLFQYKHVFEALLMRSSNIWEIHSGIFEESLGESILLLLHREILLFHIHIHACRAILQPAYWP